MRGQVVQGAVIITAIAVSIFTSAGDWIINHILSSPETQAASVSAIDTRVTTVETKQSITDVTVKNQGNKIDWLAQAVAKIGSKVGADVGQPPTNQ